jgi:hypothetical protein
MWEIFEHGLLPYTELNNQRVVEEVRNGMRLSKPKTCPDPIFEIMCAFSSSSFPLLSLILNSLSLFFLI